MAETKQTIIDPVAAAAADTDNSAYTTKAATDAPPAITFSAPFGEGTAPVVSGAAAVPRDRQGSDEWDASKVPPSRFQKRKGSIYSTPGSRDGHVDSNYAAKFHAKHAEKYSKVK